MTKEETGAEKGPKKGKLKTILYTVINIIIVVVLLDVFGRHGLYGYMCMVAGFAFWRLFKYREQFIGMLRYMESIIWGKSLDRYMWDSGEFKKRKKRKIKWVWKSKNADEERRSKDHAEAQGQHQGNKSI